MPGVEIKSGYEVMEDKSLRFGVRVINNCDFQIDDVEVILDYTENRFNIEGGHIKKLGMIKPKDPCNAEFVLKVQCCIRDEEVGGTINYRDHTGKSHSIDMPPLEIPVERCKQE